MRKSVIYVGLIGLAVAGAGLVLADEIPAGLKIAPAPRPAVSAKPSATPTPAALSREHLQGMDHGAQQMHDRMMHDHQMGLQSMSGPSGSGMPSQGAMPMPAGKACCPGKPMNPADKPMPMKDM